MKRNQSTGYSESDRGFVPAVWGLQCFACETAIADSLELVCSVQIMPSMVDNLDQV